MIQESKQKANAKPKKEEFNITDALAKRKPLRKISTAIAMAPVQEETDGSLNDELQSKLAIRKTSVGPIVGDGYQVLPWKATAVEMKKWLFGRGYASSADKVTCKSGEELYGMTRDQLKEMVGNEGIRLYSQLQADKKKAQKEGGAEKISEFQKLMKARKTAADEAKGDEGPSFLKSWGGQKNQQEPPVNQEPQDDVPVWKQKLKTRLAEKETVFDATISRPSKPMYRDTVQRQGKYGRDGEVLQNRDYEGGSRGLRSNDRDRPRRRGERYSDEEEYYRDRKYSRGRRESRYSDDERDRKHRRSRDKGKRRKGSRYSDDDDDDYESRGRKQKGSRRKRSGSYSDDDKKSRKHRKNKRRDDSYSDNESDKDRKKKSKGKDKGKKRRPTNIDDYNDSSSSYSSSDSDSTSSDSDTSSSSSGETEKKVVYPDWAIAGADPNDIHNISERIKSQQAKIKEELTLLAHIQKEPGAKSLTPEHQKTLQQDLAKLEQLQKLLHENSGNLSLQMQLLGQQMLLFEHLMEAKESIKPPPPPKEETPPPSPPPRSPSPPHRKTSLNGDDGNKHGDLRMQVLQQKALAAEHQINAMAAEHQLQALAAEQKLQTIMTQQLQAEQQRQLMAAAEQERLLMAAAEQERLQMMQMNATMSSPTAYMGSPYMITPQQPTVVGMMSPPQQSPMSPMYSPYGNPIGYF